MPNRAASNSRSAWLCPRRWSDRASEPIVRVLFEHGAFPRPTPGHGAARCVARARPARLCAGEGAVAGVFRARGHDDAASGGAEGVVVAIVLASCWAIGSALAASPPPIAFGAWSMRVRPWSGAARRPSDFRSMPWRGGGCRASCWPRSRWAGCCGLRAVAALRLGRARPRAGRRSAPPDRGGHRDLWPVPAAFWRHRLARGG